jgi:hypothetical protein
VEGVQAQTWRGALKDAMGGHLQGVLHG